MSRTPDNARHRSARPEIRNPALALPAVRAMQSLNPEVRTLLAVLLRDLQRDARIRADRCWASRKAFMAAYWSVVGVYSGHFARALATKGSTLSPEAPFLVRQDGFPACAARDWAAASRLFCQRRDERNLGVSEYPDATILIGRLPVARISYNGRIWPLGGWHLDQTPIYDNQDIHGTGTMPGRTMPPGTLHHTALR